MAFIVLPSNIDYLMTDVRLHIGDLDSERFSDSVVRTALIGAVKMLQRRWGDRYMVYDESLYITNPSQYGYMTYDAFAANGSSVAEGYTSYIPSGYVLYHLPTGQSFVASGLDGGDVFRNPSHTFSDVGNTRISQPDEVPIILAASMILRKSQISSNAESFQTWSDGDMSFSNLAAARSMSESYARDAEDLERYFRQRLTTSRRSSFDRVVM